MMYLLNWEDETLTNYIKYITVISIFLIAWLILSAPIDFTQY